MNGPSHTLPRAARTMPPSCQNCGQAGPTVEEIWNHEQGRAGGMRAMGWRVGGGTATCPACLAKERSE